MQPRHGSEASRVSLPHGVVNEETGPSAGTGRPMNLLAPETAVREEKVWGCVLSASDSELKPRRAASRKRLKRCCVWSPLSLLRTTLDFI